MQNAHEYWLKFAHTAQIKANCKRRKVGAVLVKDNHIISSGYNGTPSGFIMKVPLRLRPSSSI